MNIFPKRRKHFFRRQLFILTAISASVYSQETGVPSVPLPTNAPPEATASASGKPATGNATPASPDSRPIGNGVATADSSAPAVSAYPDTSIVAPDATTTDSTTVVNATIPPARSADSMATASGAKPPPTTSNYYGGAATVYTAPGRGMVSPPSTGRSARTRIVDTISPPPGVDSARNAAAAVPDLLSTNLPDAGAGTGNPARSDKTPRTAKIVATIGTTAAIGCIVTLILTGKLSGTKEENRQRIPDPPTPPGF